MNTRIVLWGAIGLLFVTALILTFKAGMAGSAGIGAASSVSSAVQSGMVGGC